MSFWLGIASGMAQRQHEDELLKLQDESDRRKEMASAFLKIAQDPRTRPEGQTAMAQRAFGILSTPLHKKLGKELEPSEDMMMVHPEFGGTVGQVPPAPEVPETKVSAGLPSVPGAPSEAVLPAIPPTTMPMPSGQVPGAAPMPIYYTPQEEAHMKLSQAADLSRLQQEIVQSGKLSEARAEYTVREDLGRRFGLKGDDLANFVLGRTLPRDLQPPNLAPLVREYQDALSTGSVPSGTTFPQYLELRGSGRGETEGEQKRETYAQSMFGKPFTALTGAEQRKVYEAILADARSVGQPKSTQMLIPRAGGGYTAREIKAGDIVPLGAVTPSGASSMEIPTSATRTMAEKAPRVLHFVDRINTLLDANEKQLGPLKGRWAEFTAGKVGAKNAGYIQLRTDAGLLITALMNMHVGARGGQLMIEHFRDLLNVAVQDPDNLRAALGEIKRYAEVVATEGRRGGATGAGAPPASPSEWSETMPTEGNIETKYENGKVLYRVRP
jgi:hypothetical protein